MIQYCLEYRKFMCGEPIWNKMESFDDASKLLDRLVDAKYEEILIYAIDEEKFATSEIVKEYAPSKWSDDADIYIGIVCGEMENI